MSPVVKRSLAAVLAVATFLISAGWLLLTRLGDRLEVYDGRPASFWVAGLHSPDPAISNRASVVLVTRVIPGLTGTMLHDIRDSDFRMTLVDWLNRLPGVAINYTPAEGRRSGAAMELGDLGPVAKPAIPALLEVFQGRDTKTRAPAAIALSKIGSDPATTIPLLIAALDDPEDVLPAAAAEALGNYGPLAKLAAPKLVALSRLPDKTLQRATRMALEKIGAGADPLSR